jgi:hypothetical protein
VRGSQGGTQLRQGGKEAAIFGGDVWGRNLDDGGTVRPCGAPSATG